MAKKFINIRFPFTDSKNGFLVELNETTEDAVKSDLIHLLLTKKGERYYLPDFGTNLIQFIFEPNDTQTLNSIKEEISNTIKKYMPNLQIDDITVDTPEDTRYEARIEVNYTITDDVFKTSDFIVINV